MSARLRSLVAIIGAALVSLVLLAAIYLTAPGAPGRDLSRSKPTDKGLYVATIAPESGSEPGIGDLHSWLLTLTSGDGKPVAGAQVTIDGGMPDHNHGLPTKPAVTADLGEGRYRIEGLKFSMPGWWVLRIAVAADGGTDDVAFNLQM